MFYAQIFFLHCTFACSNVMVINHDYSLEFTCRVWLINCVKYVYLVLFWSIIVVTKVWAIPYHTLYITRLPSLKVALSKKSMWYIVIQSREGFILTFSANFMAQSIAGVFNGFTSDIVTYNSAIFQTNIYHQLCACLCLCSSSEVEGDT